MTNTALLEKLYKLQHFAVMGEYGKQGEILDKLIKDVETEICREAMKKANRLKPYDVACKILKCAASDNREALHFAQLLSDGRQCVNDSFRLLIFDIPLPLQMLPKNMQGVNYEHILGYLNARPFSELELPTLPQLKAYNKCEKARGEKQPVYDFGKELCIVSSIWLADIMEITGAERCLFSGPLRALKFQGNGIEAYLLPARPGDRWREKTTLPEAEK